MRKSLLAAAICVLGLGTYALAQQTTVIGSSGITALTGDVTAGPGSGSQAATLAKIQGTTVTGTTGTGAAVLSTAPTFVTSATAPYWEVTAVGAGNSFGLKTTGTPAVYVAATAAAHWKSPGSGSYMQSINGTNDPVWDNTQKAILQLGIRQAISADNTVMDISGNAFISGAAWTYINTVPATRMHMVGTSGTWEFDTAASGTAGNPITWLPALTISVTGLVALPQLTTDATHTDSSVCQDTTTHALYSGSGAAGICLGTSSLRYKNDVNPLSVGLSELERLQPISYRLKSDPAGKVLYGFSAEQGGTVLPDLMGRDSNGKPNTFDYLGVVPVLVRSTQELNRKVSALAAQNDALRAQVRRLENLNIKRPAGTR